MDAEWLKKAMFWTAYPLLLAILRWLAPPRFRGTVHRYEEFQIPKPLPTGAVEGAMWGLGIVLALQFFVLRYANRLWASFDGPSDLTQYAPQVIWFFLPGFAALAIPWPLTVWYLRRVGRWEEADTIEDWADSRGRWNSFRIMKWLSIGLVGPLAIFTWLAIPIHLSIGDNEVRVGHYASLLTERFPLGEARRLTIVYRDRWRDSSFHPAKDVILDFADGRRLRGNQVGDGGTNVRDDVMQLLIAKTGLTPEHASTADDIPPFQTRR
jgi:hypothetical protein